MAHELLPFLFTHRIQSGVVELVFLALLPCVWRLHVCHLTRLHVVILHEERVVGVLAELIIHALDLLRIVSGLVDGGRLQLR